ncbi:MAG: TadE/TadG family type IV pilus assembly protein [Solirubrobacteraceae bacterium]
MSAGSLTRAASDAGGAVLVIVALTLPVVIGMGGLAVDVGNWFSHKRHLQVQADAGALAAAGKFRVPCVPATIENEAAKYSSVEYSGPGYSPGPGFNPQVQSTPPERLHSEINSKTFFNQATPIDPDVREGNPCAAKMIDVKLTETDLPWFLKLAQVKYINAHARVEIKAKKTSAGALPIGVPEIGPKKAKALFVDEATGTVIASTDLTRTGTSGGLALWSNAAAPVSVTVDAARIGVRIVLSGASSTQCGDPLVDCYGAGTSAAIVAGSAGLSHIRGYATTPAGTATAPKVRQAFLTTGTCTEDAYFTATVAAGSCSAGITATIDGLPSTAAVFAKRTTGANTKVPLTFSGGVWSASSGIPVTTGEGAVGIDLFFGNGNGTLIESRVQRAFAGSESLAVSGPIELLRLTEAGVSGANSFERCATCTHDLVVTLGLKPSLQVAAGVNDPPVSLKVAGGGSQNQGLDCDPNKSNIREELATGCGPTYTVNEGSPACGGGSNTLWPTPQPWKCVVINTGAAVGQVTQGMNQRILGATNASVCTAPNNWASYGTAAGLPEGDPRIVSVFLAPFGAFTGSGGTTVPVTGFADFYVTGWDGGACQGDGDDPAGQGEIIGHYIKYIDTLNNGGGGEEFCDFDSLGSCVAVFTR